MGGTVANKHNERLVLVVVLLDLVGFSIIFPAVPELIEYYVAGAPGNRLDAWLPAVLDWLVQLLPPDRRSRAELIVLVGGVLGSLYSALQFIVSPFWGRLSDRYGRRRILQVTSFGLALSYLIWAVSNSFVLFLLSRVLGGLSAGNLGVASAAMADLSTPEDRTKKMGLLGAVFGLGFIIGPAIGGLSARVDMSGLAGSLHPFSFCALVAFVMSSVSVVLNVLMLGETLPERGRAHGWVSNPFAKAGEFGIRTVLAWNFLFFLGFAGFEFTMVFFYKLEFGLTPTGIGMVFLYVGVLLVLGQGVLVRRLSPRFQEKWLAVAGVSLTGPAIYVFGQTSPTLVLSLLALAPLVLGTALVQPALAGLASLRAGAQSQGAVMGMFRSAGSLARAIGPLIGAYLYWMLGPRSAYLITALVFLPVFVGVLLLRPSMPKHPANPEAGG